MLCCVIEAGATGRQHRQDAYPCPDRRKPVVRPSPRADAHRQLRPSRLRERGERRPALPRQEGGRCISKARSTIYSFGIRWRGIDRERVRRREGRKPGAIIKGRDGSATAGNPPFRRKRNKRRRATRLSPRHLAHKRGISEHGPGQGVANAPRSTAFSAKRDKVIGHHGFRS